MVDKEAVDRSRQRPWETARDRLCRNVTPSGAPFVEGDGVVVRDADGNEYLDFASQTLNLNLGHCHPRVVETVVEQTETLHYTSSRYFDEPTLELAERLVEFAPDGLDRVNPKMTGGSLANECAVKMARKRHDADAVVTTRGSFFGETFEMMRVSGQYFETAFLSETPDVVHVEPPGSADDGAAAAEAVREVAASRDVAAVLVTPIDVNAGVLGYPEDYLRALRRICDEHDVALVFDEVQTGFGWLGEPFAADYFGVTPDIMTVAKGLSAGFPLGAVLCRPEYDVVSYGEHEFTYGAHTVASAAAVANLEVLTGDGFLDRVTLKGEYLAERLADLQSFDAVGDIRSFGLLAGVDLAADDGGDADLAEAVFEACRDRGVLFRVSDDLQGHSLVVKPPLVVDRTEIDEAVTVLADALSAVS
jgi:4-aminobutyrate aminotransferase